MTEKDFAIGVTSAPTIGHLSKKPCYLITLFEESGKSKSLIRFIALDKPSFEANFIQVKGMYCTLGDEKISKSFNEIVSSTPKDEIIDVMFPAHRVHSIKSLVFNANKPTSLMVK